LTDGDQILQVNQPTWGTSVFIRSLAHLSSRRAGPWHLQF